MRKIVLPFIAFTACVCSYFTPAAQVNMLTQHNNLLRTGWNSRENKLTPASISGGNFGLLFKKKVDDQVYAQPLVVSGIRVKGKIRNVLFTETVNNSVYAFDADDSTVGAALWHVNL